MLQDDEFDVLDTPPERVQALGFKPQKELLLNQLLPYADVLDEESNKFLEEVKTNFAKAVILREMKPGCGVWSSRLMKYIRMYGLKFSKEDHIKFIKLTFELVLVPDLEPCKLHKIATLFLMLTKARHLISPEELSLPWRPLYELKKKIFEKSTTHIGMYHYLTQKQSGNRDDMIADMIRKFMSGSGLGDISDMFGLTSTEETDLPTSMEASFIAMVKCAKPYFEVSATKEMLAEFLPQILPWSAESQTLTNMAAFLPVGLHPRHAKDGHELWFDDIMQLWDTCYNLTNGTSDIMSIFAGLAKGNPGAIDWTPHIPKMFMRFLHALHLPVSYKDMQYSRNHSLNMKHVAAWIVWCIRPDGVMLKHLSSFLAAIDSYLHSANQGRWSLKLRDLLKKLAREFLERVRREREKKFMSSWMNQTPAEMKLRDEDITSFVSILMEPTLQAVYMYSRGGALDISSALLHLATLRPALVVPPLVEKLRTSLTSLTEPHRVTASISAVAAVARPLLRGADAGYPEGPTHAVPLLMAVLPGLDPNDMKKSFLTLQFILLFTWMTPIVDCSAAHLHWTDLTEEELLTCESTAQFEDFVLVFLDRIFNIIESSITENVRLDTKETDCVRSKTDAAMETALSSASKAVLMQCSPKIFKEALRKFKDFATNTTFETNVSGSMVGVVLRVFARVDPAGTLAALLPALCGELAALLAGGDALRDETPPRALLYRLQLLMYIVECDGAVLLRYMHLITPVLDRALRLHATAALTRSCEILSRILISLSTISLKEWRSSAHDYSTAPEKWLPIREWGKGCLLKDAKLQWHVRNEEEAECCQMLVDRYLEPEVRRLEQWLSGERAMCRDRMVRAFHVVTAALAGGGDAAAAAGDGGAELVASLVPGGALRPATGERARPRLRGREARGQLAALLQRVQERLLAERGEQARALELLARVWERVSGVRPGGGAGDGRARALAALERALDAHGGPAERPHHTARLRMLLADVTRLHDEARRELACEAGPPPHVLTALHCLYELSVNPYTLVRVLAQTRLYWVLSQHAYSYRALTGRLREALAAGAAGEAGEARLKGALYLLLGPRASPLAAKHDWAVARELWPAVLNSPLSEKPSIIELEHAFSETLHHHFPSVNTRLTMTQGAIDAAKALLTETQLKDEAFVQLVAESEERERQSNEKTEQQYRELVEEIAGVVEAAGTAWRRAELGVQLLACCPSVQSAYPPRAVSAVLRALVHDDVAVRRTAFRLAHYVLKQRKLPLKKIFVDPYEVAGVPRPATPVRGYRKDLEWAMWTQDEVLQTDEEWDRPWLRTYTVGFYSWPDKLEVTAPASEQKFVFDIAVEDMEEGQRYIHEFFTSDENVDKLVKFLTVEEKKGKDKFSGIRFGMFRMLFANFGEDVAERLVVHALRCASSEQEAPQRFAGEVGAAALRAARHWRRGPARRMQTRALAVLQAGLAAVTPDTADEWGTALATALAKQCPRRAAPVLQALLAQCLPAAAGPATAASSFAVCARLYALQGALGSLVWRAAPLARHILTRLDEDNFTQHPYQNVREIVGSMLMTIFDTELIFPGNEYDATPHLASFIETVKPRLAALYNEDGDIIIKTATSPLQLQCDTQEVSSAACPEPAVNLPLIGQVSHLSADVGQLSPERVVGAAAAAGPASGSGSASPGEAGCGAALERALAARLDAALRLAGDGGAAGGHARAVCLLSTLLRGTMGVIVRAAGHDTRAAYSLVPVACALTARGAPQPHDELPRAADGFLASLARQHHSREDFEKALLTMEELADARSWWARLACLHFAQPLLFYGLPMLCDQADYAMRAERFALKLMRDPRLEVRQSAAKLLTGLMHCRALPDEDKTLNKLIKCCRSAEIVEKHMGVLGLCAYLASRPYGVGARLGAALGELARQASAPDPVPAAIRAAIADFRRTHHDDWPRHRAALSQGDLDLLADLTSPPSYCA